MFGEPWKTQSTSAQSSCTDDAKPYVRIPRKTTSNKRASAQQLEMQKTLRSHSRPSREKKHRGTGRRNMMNEMERKALLERDAWAGEVTEISVECKGCQRIISLDKRFTYYPGLWIKHRQNCSVIRRLEVREAEKSSKREQTMNIRGNVTQRGESSNESTSSTPQDACGRAPTSMEGKREDYSDVDRHPRYDAGPSCQFVRAEPLPMNAEGSNSATRNMNARVTAPQYWKSINDGSFEKSYQQSASTMERPRFYEISNVDERDHWTIAPFQPPDQDAAASHVSGRRLYRYSTRWELATNFQGMNIPFSDGGGVNPFSEDDDED